MTNKLLAYPWRFWLAVLLTGLLSGLVGIAMHLLLNGVEWLAYSQISESYLSLVEGVAPLRRLLALLVMTVLVAVIWFFLQRETPLVSVKLQAQSNRKDQLLPRFWQHVIHTFLQIAFVGAGGSVGKEGAPRELGSLCAGRLGRWLGLRLRDRHLLIVCGAAAGLAAIYQVPLSSFFFAFETFALAISLRTGLAVLLTTYIAAGLANPVVTSRAMYELGQLSFQASDLVAIVVLVLLVTPLASLFRTLTQKTNQYRRKDKSILYWLPLAGLLTGLVALNFPNILGNGSALAQSAFDGLDWSKAILLLGLKAALVLGSLLAGAYGGTLTPSFALGSLLGLLSFHLLQQLLGITQLEVLMLAGAASFLAITMQAPLTAAGLTLAFTKQGPAMLIPILVAVGLAMALSKAWSAFLSRLS